VLSVDLIETSQRPILRQPLHLPTLQCSTPGLLYRGLIHVLRSPPNDPAGELNRLIPIYGEQRWTEQGPGIPL